ncbi:MAG TPA: serine/threonine-protein kinase [Polyangiaceae bacterium]|jgi:serine/threonine-protein kinase|nr:serine/threonine-protein kinase [Polyangiaceae bacterium]
MAHAPTQRYRVIEKIAAGGMAEVFRAESAGLEGFKKTVAIKRVLPHLSQKKQFIGMFLDEARLSASLSHSNVVQVFDIGVGDETYFIVMEYVDGANLKAVIEHRKQVGKPLPMEVAALIALRTCEGLAYAHEAQDALGQPLGIVHRDVSPPNVLITRHGEVKVVDFGLAKANSQLEASEPGIIKGKFSYLSPEAANGEEVDHRTDIFATGIMLWEMITGQRLFLGDTDLGTVRLVQAARIPPLAQYVKDVPAALEQSLQHALARDPKNRYQTAREFGRDLNRVLFQMGRPVSSFDIGGLVADVREEQRRQRGARPKQQTLIGNLIQDAMMSFTSLQEDEESDSALDPGPDEQSGVGAIPLSFGTFEGSHAATRLPTAEPSQVNLAAPGGYEAGNLAALEDQGFDAPRGHSQPPRSQPGGAPRPPPPKGARPSVRPPARNLPAPGYPGGHPPHLAPAPSAMATLPLRFWIIAAALVLIGVALAAYMAGVFS